MQIKLISRVNNGRLSTVISNELNVFIRKFEGKELEITIQKKRSKRTDRQSRYYFGCVVPIIQQALKDLGHTLTKEEVHEWLKGKFNPTDLHTHDGEYLGNIPKSTTTLTKTEFGEYIEQIAQWSAEFLNTVIPEPNQQIELV